MHVDGYAGCPYTLRYLYPFVFEAVVITCFDRKKPDSEESGLKLLVGTTGFEPATP